MVLTTQGEQKPKTRRVERKPQRARVKTTEFKIFSGTANAPLAQEICDFLGLPRGQCHLTQFSDGEIYVQVLENVRGADVFVVQPTCDPVAHNTDPTPADDRCPEAGFGAPRHPVIPYFGYARQDRKDKPRVPDFAPSWWPTC